jgi:hypothetical protein
MDGLRVACAKLADRTRHVRVHEATVPEYAASLLPDLSSASDDAPCIPPAEREAVAEYWLTLDAINFGSGWFPTLRKRGSLTGYRTIAARWSKHHERHEPFGAAALARIDAATLAAILGQDPRHELMALYTASLNDLGARVQREHDGRFLGIVEAAAGSAVALATALGHWCCFADVSAYGDLSLPFLKRAQIAAADLHRAGVVRFDDLDRLTMFADNLVPHVLRLDGVLSYDDELVAQIESGQLIEHDSLAEIEIRGCALHAVESIVSELHRQGLRDATAVAVDELLWNRGQGARYKAVPRHRSRCTAY